ncbi:MAG: hypothetical protein ABH858_05685 [Candidatus Omnitrophota bacterium]
MISLLPLIIFFIGFSSLLAQSVFIREIVVALSGNEILIGLILSSWLFWTGAGSFIFGKIAEKIKEPLTGLILSQISFIILIFVEFFLIGSLRIFLAVEPGQVVNPYQAAVASIFIIAPFALVNGFLFSLCIKIFSHYIGSRSVGLVYSYDALGDMSGGIVFSFLFVFLFSPLTNLYIAAAINALICAITSSYIIRYQPNSLGQEERNYYSIGSGKDKKNNLYDILMPVSVSGIWPKLFSPCRFHKKILLSILLIAFFAVGFYVRPWENYLMRRQWRGFDIVDKKISFYGNFHLARDENIFSLYENGSLSFTFPAPLESQEEAHVPLLQSGSLKRILVIGEGIKGILKEVLKYPVDEVYYLELDPVLIDFLKKYLQKDGRDALIDPRVKIFNSEARAFLNNYKGDKFDAVLLNTPPPYNAYLNRFYTYEFFNKIKDIINYSGVFSFTLPSKNDYLPEELRDFNASIYHTVKKVFPGLILIPGEDLRFVASLSADYLTYDPDILWQRLKEYNLNTTLVNRFYFKMKLLPWHIDYVNNVLENHRAVRLNYDFSPVTYYYGLRFFLSHFRLEPANLFAAVAKIKPQLYFIIFFLLWLIIYIIKKKYVLVLSLFSLGACGMAAVILSIFAFQVIHGYVYHKITLISAFFMLGAAFGARLINKFISRVNYKNIVYLCFIGSIYLVFIPYIFRSFANSRCWGEFFSFFIPFVIGGIVGICFPLINNLYNRGEKRLAESAGLLYFFDLLGGAFSGLLLSLVFIPLYGLFVSSAIISFTLFLSSLALFFYLRRYG